MNYDSQNSKDPEFLLCNNFVCFSGQKKRRHAMTSLVYLFWMDTFDVALRFRILKFFLQPLRFLF